MQYFIINCKSCDYFLLDEGDSHTILDKAQHRLDHQEVGQEEPEWEIKAITQKEYEDHFDFAMEMYQEFRSEIKVGYMPKGTTFSQWHVHNEMIGDENPDDFPPVPNTEEASMDINALKRYLKANHQLADSINWDEVEIEVLMSGGGYYIGTLDPETGEPDLRLSTDYYRTHEEAEEALKTGKFNLKLWP